MERINKDIDVVSRWEEAGCLTGIEEGEKKYLADLYDYLYDKIIGMKDTEKVILADKLKLEMLGVLGKEGDWVENLNSELLDLLMPVLRRVYEINNRVSINEFYKCLDDIDVDNWFLNNNMYNSNKHSRVSTGERLSNYIVEKINECVNK